MRFLTNKSFTQRIIILILIVLAGYAISMALFSFFLLAKSGMDNKLFNELLLQSMSNPGMIRLLQFLNTTFIFIIPPFAFVYLFKDKSNTYLGLKAPKPAHILLAILSIIVAIPLINLLVTWNESLRMPEFMSGIESWMKESEKNAGEVTEKILSGTNISSLLINLLIIAMMPGIGEELFFRGLLQKIFTNAFANKKKDEIRRNKWSKHLAIWAVAIIFSAIHLQFYGFIPRMLLGVWFGYLLFWTGSVWVPIIAHITNNSLSTIFAFAENNNYINEDPNIIGIGETHWLSIISLVLILIISLYFVNAKRNPAASGFNQNGLRNPELRPEE
jgi:membrane protease YdiL (CAAX protease family)